MSSAVILALCTVALAAAATNNRCLPAMVGKTPFDADKFSGDWFVVAGVHTNTKMAVPPNCVKVKYGVLRQDNGTRITLDVIAKVDGKETVIGSSRGQPVLPGRDAAVTAAWRHAGKEYVGMLQQSVLATDYTRFAVFYGCRPMYLEDSDSFEKMEVVDVWSRTPDIDAALLDVLKIVLSGYDLPVDRFKLADNTVC